MAWLQYVSRVFCLPSPLRQQQTPFVLHTVEFRVGKIMDGWNEKVKHKNQTVFGARVQTPVRFGLQDHVG